jgi:hypothetical protein
VQYRSWPLALHQSSRGTEFLLVNEAAHVRWACCHWSLTICHPPGIWRAENAQPAPGISGSFWSGGAGEQPGATAADPRDEVICLRGSAESPPAVETPIILQRCDTVPEDLGGNHAAGSG